MKLKTWVYFLHTFFIKYGMLKHLIAQQQVKEWTDGDIYLFQHI